MNIINKIIKEKNLKIKKEKKVKNVTPIKEFDLKGNEIHYRDSNGFEFWKEYDSKGNEIYYRDSNEYESWSEYDSKGNLIHYKNSDEFEFWREYDSEGNEVKKLECIAGVYYLNNRELQEKEN